VIISAGEEKSSNEENSEEEDRKEEISFPLYVHTHFLGWRSNSPAFFLRSSFISKTRFYGKMQA